MTHDRAVLSPRFHDALSFASRLHETQLRKDTQIPYVSHLLAVAGIVLEAGGTEDEAIAALLHDGPEDRGGLSTLARIRERFGTTVADIVDACSDTFEDPKPPWLARKRAYIAHLASAGPSVLLVSAADKLHNARATLRDVKQFGDRVWRRFSATREETLWNYESLIKAYDTAAPDPRRTAVVTELAEVVRELRTLARRAPRIAHLESVTEEGEPAGR